MFSRGMFIWIEWKVRLFKTLRKHEDHGNSVLMSQNTAQWTVIKATKSFDDGSWPTYVITSFPRKQTSALSPISRYVIEFLRTQHQSRVTGILGNFLREKMKCIIKALFQYMYFACDMACLLITITMSTNPLNHEPPHDKTNKMACAPSEDSDQPGYPPILTSVFAVCWMGS